MKKCKTIEDGIASDRVVSQKIIGEAVCLFAEDQKEPETDNDIFNYMYGRRLPCFRFIYPTLRRFDHDELQGC